MKLATICFAIAVSTTPLILSTSVDFTDKALPTDDLLACGWFPSCGDPDIYSPLSTPKDSKSKTETQDTKNEKLA